MNENFEVIQVAVVWIAAVHHLDGSGQIVQRMQTLGRFPNKFRAEEALVNYGLLPAPDSSIYPFISKDRFSYGTVSRVLSELTSN